MGTNHADEPTLELSAEELMREHGIAVVLPRVDTGGPTVVPDVGLVADQLRRIAQVIDPAAHDRHAQAHEIHAIADAVCDALGAKVRARWAGFLGFTSADRLLVGEIIARRR